MQISAAFAQANRWVDLRLLDLWSIFVLLSVGLLCLVVSLAAIGSGQYVALLLALGAGLYLLTATRWLLAIDFTLCTRRARRHLRMIAPTRRRKLLAWLTLDAALFILAWFVLIRARAV